MSDNTKLPLGWDPVRIDRVLSHYEAQSDVDAVLEDETGVRPGDTVMDVPHELVPKIRELIAKHAKTS